MPKDYSIYYRSESYLHWVRCNPCALCGGAVTQAHHEPLGDNYMGGKPPDSYAIPLCAACHHQRHERGPEWLEKMIDVKKLIIKLLTWYVRDLETKHGKK